jgi:hypothetical protein
MHLCIPCQGLRVIQTEMLRLRMFFSLASNATPEFELSWHARSLSAAEIDRDVECSSAYRPSKQTMSCDGTPSPSEWGLDDLSIKFQLCFCLLSSREHAESGVTEPQAGDSPIIPSGVVADVL